MKIIPHVKFFVSSKVTLLDEKVNKELKELRDAGYEIDCVTSNISYAGEKGYMVLAQIDYHEEIFDEDEIVIEEVENE